MIWVMVSSQSCFLLTVESLSIFGSKEFNQSDFSVGHLVMSMYICPVFSSVVGRGCFLWPVSSLALISQASKVMFKILQTRLQQYVNRELPDVQAGFRKGRGARDQIANICWIIKKAREFQKNIYFCFIDYAKAVDCVDHNKLWKILTEMGVTDHLTYLLWNLYAGQEATVRTGHGKTDWFQIGKGLHQAVYCHPAYLTFMQSTSWEMLGWRKHKLESGLPGEISISSDTTLMAESEEEVKSLLMKVKKESEKVGLKLNI